MISNFKHKKLKRLHTNNDESGVGADILPKVKRVLSVLDAATDVNALSLPSFKLHPLTGDMEGYYSVRVSGNWRIIFRFDNETAYDVDLVDYH